MLLEILLIILITIILTIGISVVYWWKKYGKKMFGMIGGLSDLKSKINPSIDKINKIQQPDIKMTMDMLKSIMGSMPKKSNNQRR